MLKSLAYCGILLSGVGAILLAMIHAQGDPDDIYGDVIALPPESSAGDKIVTGGRGTEQAARRTHDGSHSHDREGL